MCRNDILSSGSLQSDTADNNQYPIAAQRMDAMREQVAISVADRFFIQNCINIDTALLRRIVKDLENSGVSYSIGDIIKSYKSPGCHVSVLDFMQTRYD